MMWEAPPQPEVTETRSPNTPFSRISEETPDTVLFDSTTEVGVARKPVATIPLSSLTAFSSLPDQLQAMTVEIVEIAASLTSEVFGMLKVDLVERIYGSSEVVPVGSAQLCDRLRPLVHGLMKRVDRCRFTHSGSCILVYIVYSCLATQSATCQRPTCGETVQLGTTFSEGLMFCPTLQNVESVCVRAIPHLMYKQSPPTNQTAPSGQLAEIMHKYVDETTEHPPTKLAVGRWNTGKTGALNET
ncbi:hypothetical protein EW146_g2128 [Bondarzewia mesenterica]|uniref:Uncharacterized protein n=1 Tax=Bondarzewia mesenterica TaxID=1095465 RepID=A0A4S4M1I2_9AGAM|nr:hypothetical protein EW146_g2128 [Bondarzewia mesenterica]